MPFLAALNSFSFRLERKGFSMSTKLYVGNLPFTTDENDLRALFEEEGRKVDDVVIILDRLTGKPRGFAFVNMRTAADASAAAQALHGTQYGGRTLTVNEAKAKDGVQATFRPAKRHAG
jgi:RNA recognition motif-containing protein